MPKCPLATADTAVRRLVAVGLVIGLGSCVEPTMLVQTQPENALVWIDGRAVGRPTEGAAIEMRRRYYGTTTIHARRSNLRQDMETLDASYQLRVDEPFSPWLFPFDFVLEALSYPFQTDRYRYRVELKLPSRQPLVGGVLPRNLGVVREHARQAVLAR